MSVIMHWTTYLALSWQTRPPSGRSEWPVTRTAAITTPAVVPVTPPLRTPLLDPRGLNPQLPPAVRSTELLNRLNRVLLSSISVSFGNSLRVNVLSYCFNRQATKPYARLERPKKPNQKYSITKGGYFALRKAPLGYGTENLSLYHWDCALVTDFPSSLRPLTWSYSHFLLLMALYPFGVGGGALVVWMPGVWTRSCSVWKVGNLCDLGGTSFLTEGFGHYWG